MKKLKKLKNGRNAATQTRPGEAEQAAPFAGEKRELSRERGEASPFKAALYLFPRVMKTRPLSLVITDSERSSAAAASQRRPHKAALSKNEAINFQDLRGEEEEEEEEGERERESFSVSKADFPDRSTCLDLRQRVAQVNYLFFMIFLFFFPSS